MRGMVLSFSLAVVVGVRCLASGRDRTTGSVRVSR